MKRREEKWCSRYGGVVLHTSKWSGSRQQFSVKCTHSYPISLYLLYTLILYTPRGYPSLQVFFTPTRGWQPGAAGGGSSLPQTTLKKVNNSIPVALCYLHPLSSDSSPPSSSQTFLQMTSAFKSFSFPKLLSPSRRCIVVFWCKKNFNFFRTVVRWFSTRRSFFILRFSLAYRNFCINILWSYQTILNDSIVYFFLLNVKVFASKTVQE